MSIEVRLVLIAVAALLLAVAAFWPSARDEVALSRGAANKLEPEPSYSFVPYSTVHAAAGVYLRDGQPRYSLMGKDVTADEFRRAMTPQGWEQAQAWIREQTNVVR